MFQKGHKVWHKKFKGGVVYDTCQDPSIIQVKFELYEGLPWQINPNPKVVNVDELKKL